MTKVCPYCAFDIPAVASRCGYCTADLTDAQRRALLLDFDRVLGVNLSGPFYLLRRFVQKAPARGVLPARIGVREKMADIGFANCTQHRITNGVHQHIGIRMPHRSFGVRNFNATDNELIAPA